MFIILYDDLLVEDIKNLHFWFIAAAFGRGEGDAKIKNPKTNELKFESRNWKNFFLPIRYFGPGRWFHDITLLANSPMLCLRTHSRETIKQIELFDAHQLFMYLWWDFWFCSDVFIWHCVTRLNFLQLLTFANPFRASSWRWERWCLFNFIVPEIFNLERTFFSTSDDSKSFSFSSPPRRSALDTAVKS